MAGDKNFVRFFAYLSFFSGAMLGLVISNSLLLLFICWELVGLASYLLIGFWIERRSAAAAAKKAFITTRIGDLGFFLGLLWLYGRTGNLLFYDGGNGCLESAGLAMRRIDGHSRFQRVCRGNHDPDWRMENLSHRGLDHGGRDGPCSRFHLARAGEVFLW